MAQLSLIFSLIQWYNNCHLYSPLYNDTIVTYILPHTMIQLSLIFSLIQWYNLQLPSCHLHLTFHSSSQHHDPPPSNIVFPIKAPKHLQCLAVVHSALQSTHRYSQLAVEFPRYSQQALSRQLYCRPRFVFRRIGHRNSYSTSHNLRALSMNPAPRHTSGT
jgi:hypothetical protein